MVLYVSKNNLEEELVLEEQYAEFEEFLLPEWAYNDGEWLRIKLRRNWFKRKLQKFREKREELREN